MSQKIILTGLPKSGKSTLLKKIIQHIPNKVGFVTNEILGSEGRLGFEIETNMGHKVVLAHVNFDTPLKVSKYSVKIDNLESIIPEVAIFKNDDLLYLDEIGQMQLFSNKFKELALKYLESNNNCIMTLSQIYEDDFICDLKKRDDIVFVELDSSNREDKEKVLRQMMCII